MLATARDESSSRDNKGFVRLMVLDLYGLVTIKNWRNLSGQSFANGHRLNSTHKVKQYKILGQVSLIQKTKGEKP